MKENSYRLKKKKKQEIDEIPQNALLIQTA